MKLKKHRAGVAVGIFAGLCHLVWVIIVGLGLGQIVLDRIHNVHHLTNPYTVTSLEVANAIILVAMAGVVGYLSGWVFAGLWNRLNK